MQTRDEFLSTRLVPVHIQSTVSADIECPICLSDDLTNPVQTPCNHIFDKECIETWLNGAKRNTCPLCKTELFTLPTEETMTRAALRRQQVGRALQTSNVISRQPPFDNFGSTEYDTSSLQRAVANATYILGQGHVPAAGEYFRQDDLGEGVVNQVTGPCLIYVQVLSPAFVAMANLLPALAEAQSRVFSPSAARTWKALCTALWPQIRALNGRKADAMVLPALLKQKTHQALSTVRPMGEIDTSHFEGSNSDLFDVLLNYLTLRAWQVEQARERRKRAERESRESRCAVM